MSAASRPFASRRDGKLPLTASAASDSGGGGFPSHSSDLSLSTSGSLAAEIRAMPCDTVADTLWAMLLARGYESATFATVAQSLLEDLEGCTLPALISVLAAFAEAEHFDRDYIASVTRKLAKPYALAGLDTTAVAQAVWTFAVLETQGHVRLAGSSSTADAVDVSEAVSALIKSALRQANDISSEDIARLLGGLGELRAPGTTLLLDALSQRMQSILLPLSQLSPPALAQSVWSFARLGSYHRQLFDDVQAQLISKAGELDMESLSQAVWAFQAVRERDSKHRAVHDVNFFAAMAKRVVVMLDALTAPTAIPNVQSKGADMVSTGLVVNVLLSYATLSHSDPGLLRAVSKYLSPKLGQCSPQELVIIAFSLSRLKYKSSELMQSMSTAIQPLLDFMDGEDLVILAAAGPATETYSQPLMQAVIEKALERSKVAGAGRLEVGTVTLLELVRCVAAVQHHDPEYYRQIEADLLHAINASYKAQDLDQMSTHCGATNPLGLQK